MPTYDYACAGCGGFEAIRSLTQRDAPIDCPRLRAGLDPGLCRRAAPCLDGGGRAIGEQHQRARSSRTQEFTRPRPPQAPRRMWLLRHRQARRTLTGANGSKTFPGKRPWMISH